MSTPVTDNANPGPAPERVRLDFPDCDIWIHVTSSMEEQWRARSCAKEPWTVDWIRTQVGAGDVLYDIGANVGTFSLLAARHRGALVVAFEPGYANFARLCENIQLNGCQGSIIPVPLPLAESSGLVGFKYRSLDPGQSRHGLRQDQWHFREDAQGPRYEQPVCAIQLDQAVTLFRLPPPSHLKIDVDGAEQRVLDGAGEVLAMPSLRSILIEIDIQQWDPVVARLADAGFALEQKHGHFKKADAPLYGVFTRPAAPAKRQWAFWK